MCALERPKLVSYTIYIVYGEIPWQKMTLLRGT